MTSKLRWVDRARIGRESPNNKKKSMGNRKKLEAFKESVIKSIKLVFTFSAKLSCALVLASHHGGRVKYMYDFGYTFLDSFILW